jgi:CheY-like chemotaxis protein
LTPEFLRNEKQRSIEAEMQSCIEEAEIERSIEADKIGRSIEAVERQGSIEEAKVERNIGAVEMERSTRAVEMERRLQAFEIERRIEAFERLPNISDKEEEDSQLSEHSLSFVLETEEEDITVGPTVSLDFQSSCSSFSVQPKQSAESPMNSIRSFADLGEDFRYRDSIGSAVRLKVSTGGNREDSSRPSYTMPPTIPHRSEMRVYEEGPPKVLLVEHNEVDRAMLTKCLVDICEVEPDIAVNEAEALRLYKAYTRKGFMYSCICMNISLWQHYGLDAAVKIRELERQENTDKTFILGLYKELTSEDKESCMDYGLDALVFKTYEEVKSYLIQIL